MGLERILRDNTYQNGSECFWLLSLAGTKGGEKKIPESLGLAPGVVFLLCIIFFQLLHFYDAAAVLDWVSLPTLLT